MEFNSAQERFWADTYAQRYIEKNRDFDTPLAAKAWAQMLRATDGQVGSYLECGCNVGRNIAALKIALPTAFASVVEISRPAFEFVSGTYSLDRSFNGAILDSDFERASFDLVFTMGVLIHINPDQLLENPTKVLDYSRKFILVGEYFNRTPVSLEYQGESDKLYKRDFGKFLLENFDVKCVDYGFLWSQIYGEAGFDDVTWWLFEKQS